MKRAGLLLAVGMVAVVIAVPGGANATAPAASAAKKCKKHKHDGKKKHKKCKKKKGKKPPTTNTGPLVISPASWDFGAFPIGLGSGSQQFTITNTEAGATGPLGASFGGANPGNFTDAGGDFCTGTSLAGGSHCSVFVACHGSGTLPATFNGTLVVSANPGGTREAALTCRQF